MLQMVISGGQTGVDRAALDAAIEAGIPIAGWCPLGRRAEDGVIPAQYPLTETATADYAERTGLNVRDSEGTIILTRGELTGGTMFTLQFAEKAPRPVRIVRLAQTPDCIETWDWIMAHRIHVLNIAGPRESKDPGIYAAARGWLRGLLDHAVKQLMSRQFSGLRKVTIENCILGNSCHKQWKELKPDATRPDIRHCDQCNKPVYFCPTNDTLYWHSRAGHCVAFVRRQDQKQDKGKLYLGGDPLARPQTDDVLKWE